MAYRPNSMQRVLSWVKSQAKFVQPLLQVGAELFRISTGLEACDKVIGVADQYRFALCRLLAPFPVEPKVST